MWRGVGSSIWLVLGAARLCAAQPDSPSFDCAKATGPAEKLVCSDPGLVKLDRKLSELYKRVEKDPKLAAGQKASQRKWIAERNACAKSSDANSCVESSYGRRIAEIQILSGSLAAPKTGSYDCGGTSLTAAYYNDTEPPSAVLKYGNDQAIALVQRSASGARYGAPGIELWEHQGEAMVTWRGKKFTCKVK